MQMNEQNPLAHAGSLSFGPEWMRPKLSRPSEEMFSSQAQQQPSSWSSPTSDLPKPTSNKTSYTQEQMLKVYATLQDKLLSPGFEEKFGSLEPIRELVRQVEHDRSVQAQAAATNSAQNGKRPYHGARNAITGTETSVDHLTVKLNEINSWAKQQNNGLDFDSILNNAAVSKQQAQYQPQTQKQSPFLSSHAPLHMQREQSVFASMNSPLSASSGLPFAEPQSVLPDNVKWFYVDPNGTEQGPFDSQTMQNWYSLEYLKPELQLRRDGEFNFILLRDFVSQVGNNFQPFLVPIPSQQSQSPNSQFNPFDQQIPGLYGQGFMAQPQAQTRLSQFQSQQNAWDLGNSGRSSPWLQSDRVNSGLSSDYLQGGFMSNGVFGGQSTSDYTGPQPLDDDLFNHIQSQVLGTVLDNSELTSSGTASETIRMGNISSEIDPAVGINEQALSSTPGSVETNQVSHEAPPLGEPKQQLPSKQETKSENTSKTAPVKKSKTVKVTTASGVAKNAQTEAKAAPPAPWAAQAATFTTPQVTLEEIQKIESQEKSRQQKLRAQKAAQMLSNAEKAILEEEVAAVKQPALPPTSSWASTNKIDTPAKTLADIQREEAEASARAAKQAQSAYQSQHTFSTQAKSSFASIANTSAPPQSAWTVVTSKKPQPKVQNPPLSVHSSTKPVTPDVLRSVSASAPAPFSQTQKTGSPRQEFLSWCRSTLKLNHGVKVEDVLQIMLMLPVGSESSEIIADTIYSNSSTMDGRRFAQEFMKRRKAVEDQAQDGLSWNDALHISANDDDDGWDFQVVSKKKGKRRS